MARCRPSVPTRVGKFKSAPRRHGACRGLCDALKCANIMLGFRTKSLNISVPDDRPVQANTQRGNGSSDVRRHPQAWYNPAWPLINIYVLLYKTAFYLLYSLLFSILIIHIFNKLNINYYFLVSSKFFN